MSWTVILGAVAVTAVVLAGGSILALYFATGVPPIPAKRAEARDVVALLRQAGLPEGARIYELGCGWGSLAIDLARAFPSAQVIGVEISPLVWAVARLRARWQPNLQVRWGSFHALSLADADAVTCYLMIRPMPEVAALLDRELRAGTPVVALTFWFRDRRPTATRRGPGLRGDAALYAWPARS